MAKVNKQELADKILETWKISDEINMAVGLVTDSDENLVHQMEVAFGEFKEGIISIKNQIENESYDALLDLHVTVPTCLMMYSGNKDLLLEPPRIYDTGMDFNDLLHDAQKAFLSTKAGRYHFIDAVDCLVDAVVATDINPEKFIQYANAVNTSNLSKFPLVGTVDPEAECDYIESKGRYTDVYFEEGELLGKKVYIFKSCYDKENNERFPNGKYLKPSKFIDVQELL